MSKHLGFLCFFHWKTFLDKSYLHLFLFRISDIVYGNTGKIVEVEYMINMTSHRYLSVPNISFIMC